MATLRGNLTANLAGRGWSALLNIAFPPLYAKYLGIEAYGIVGVYASLVGLMGVIDLGLTTTLNREMARLSTKRDAMTMRSTLKTFEMAFWALALAAAAAIFLLAPVIGTRWVHAAQVPAETVTSAIRLCAFVLALQWPGALYAGGLAGLERQGAANVLLIVFSTVRFGGSALILLAVSRTVHAFFAWQGLSFALQTLGTRFLLGRMLPGGLDRPRFSVDILRRQWRLSAGISLVTVLSMILTNVDKVVASKLLSLENFGYYTLSWTVGVGLYTLIAPVFVAVFPRLTQAVHAGDEAAERDLYHTAAQVMAVLVLPAAAVIVAFSRQVVLAWTGDATTAAAIAGIVALLTVGSALNGLMSVPYALQLAHGWTRLAACMNLVGVALLVPVVVTLTRSMGGLGAATGWAALNVAYCLTIVPIQHRRILKGAVLRWYARDTAPPLLAASVVCLALRRFEPRLVGRAECLAWLLLSLTLSYTAAAVASPAARAYVLRAARRTMRRAA